MNRTLCIRISALAAALCLLLTMAACSGRSAEIIADGKVDNLRWAVDSSGCLSFTGTGAIPGVEYVFNTSTGLTDTVYPRWYDHRDSITRVVIGGGIDSVSMNAFMYFPELEEMDFAATVGAIDGYAVTGCSSLRRVIIRCPSVEMEKFCIGYSGGVAEDYLSQLVFQGVSGSQTESYAGLCGARFSRL